MLLHKFFSDDAVNVRGRVIGLYTILISANLLAWAWALIAFRDYPMLLGAALLAYSFGLRHAFDADHIAAIDNVTRKLMQEGKRPVAAGFFFSLGHSTVVVVLSIGIAATALALQSGFDSLKAIGSFIGTGISALFLFAIATANIVVLNAVWRSIKRVKRGFRLVDENLNKVLENRGLITRLSRPLFRIVERSWHLYPIGLLFGLGFDTATEVGLLGISAAEAIKGVSLWSILVFPALFTTGMSLVDTTDGILMQGVYGWAFVKPIRKLYYNLSITFVSVAVALAVAGIEIAGLLVARLNLQGGFWDSVALLNVRFGTLGYIIVGIFLLTWLVSVAIFHFKRYGGLDMT